ncbi:hypothetical protein CcCBS67573_g06961 [Chytriomyces confervae]|uniref:30S ribosomal protein S9, chloroplastic n=1 Tax=Chytriomyces confervae TaxID=246404 RepID=A0A507F045_9FUNG|nr:hypothetical protein CcCBS67573_g06961 [Chytriomyces confervae]
MLISPPFPSAPATASIDMAATVYVAVRYLNYDLRKKGDNRMGEQRTHAVGNGLSIVMSVEAVQTYGRKKTATAVAFCKKGNGLIKINGSPLELVQPEVLKLKVYEPILILGQDKFAGVDIRVRVKGGGNTSQIYAIRQAIAKAIVAYYQKYVDEASKRDIKTILTNYDRSLLVADPRRCEPKKFGGRGARARFQKSYR